MDRNTVKLLGVIGGLIALVIAVSTLWNMGAFDSLVGRNTPEAIEARLEDEMENHPAFSALYITLKSEFPEDYDRLKADMVEAFRERGQPGDAIAAGDQFFVMFMQRNLQHFENAPTASILEMRDRSIAVVDKLASEDLNLCARFTMNGLRPQDQPSMDAQVLLGQAAKAKLVAISAGIADPVTREAPTPGDIDAYAKALSARGMSEHMISDFFSGAFALARESAQVQCDNGVVIYGAMADLPDEQSARLGAILLSGIQ